MLTSVYGDRASTEIEKVRNNLNELLQEYYSRSNSRNNKSMGVGSSSFVHTGDVDDGLKRESKLRQFMKTCVTTPNDNQVKIELDPYLGETLLPLSNDDDNFDILIWWKQSGTKFPILQTVARDLLAIPVSTVASESAFSTSGRVITSHRSRLKPTTIEALMCTQSWLSNGIIGNFFILCHILLHYFHTYFILSFFSFCR